MNVSLANPSSPAFSCALRLGLAPWQGLWLLLLAPMVFAGPYVYTKEDAAYSASWGPAVGEVLPQVEAQDQQGRLRRLPDLTGEQGLLLFLVRSADW